MKLAVFSQHGLISSRVKNSERHVIGFTIASKPVLGYDLLL